MLFSIIIAVKNKEKYIIDTVNSCLNQNIKRNNFEIIIINDASTDNTRKKIEKYYNKINIIIKNLIINVGPGIARNYGLNISKGKYIIFLDGDDELTSNALKSIKKKLYNKPDIITFNFNKILKKKKILHARKDFLKIKKNKIILLNNFLSGQIDGSVIFSCFKKKFLIKNNIKFPNGLHEDIVFIFKSYLHAKKIVKFNKVLYIKNQVENSITATISKKRINDLLNTPLRLTKILKNYPSYNKNVHYFAKIGFVGYVADTVKEIKRNKKITTKKKKKLLNMILVKTIKFPGIKKYNYVTTKDFYFKKFIRTKIYKNSNIL